MPLGPGVVDRHPCDVGHDAVGESSGSFADITSGTCMACHDPGRRIGNRPGSEFRPRRAEHPLHSHYALRTLTASTNCPSNAWPTGNARAACTARWLGGLDLGHAISTERPGVVVGVGVGDREPAGIEQSRRWRRRQPHGVQPPAVREQRRRGPPVRGLRRHPARTRSSTRAAGRAWPANSQITVRSFGSVWKHRPLSMPQILPSPRMQCPLLRSALLATTSNAQIARSWSW